MLAILQKTVGPNFKAGDVIRGENSRIKRLSNQGLVTKDHSLIGMVGSILSIVFSILLIIFVVLTSFPHITYKYLHVNFSPLWSLTFVAMSLLTIALNIKYFITGKMPYITYFLSFNNNIFGGIMIMGGHESTSSKYQPATISTTAAIILYSISAIAIADLVISNVVWNESGYFSGTSITWTHMFGWILYVLLMIAGIIFAIYFDVDYDKRRKRYINFLKKKNATIEYKTKALNAFRAYKMTGNADKFMEKNISILEETLDVDRKQIKNEKKK